MSAPEADVLAVWSAHQEYRKIPKVEPSRGGRRQIEAALNAGYSADDLILVVRWAHESPNKRASFLRGRAYEAGESSVGDYLGVENLMRREQMETRVGWAKEWVAEGRPSFRDAPVKVDNREREERIVKVLDQIVKSQGNPEATENPALTRAILGGLYDLGISVAWLGGIDKDQVRWEYPKIARQLMRHADELRAKVKGVGRG